MSFLHGFILNKTGGLSYHQRAFKYKRKFWGEFNSKIKAWQDKLPQNSEELLLIGPSAGYNLSVEYISKFKKLYVLEIDPLAVKILHSKIPSSIEFCAPGKNFLPAKVKNKNDLVNSFNILSETFQNCDFLFCNFLGQLPLILPTLTSEELQIFFKQEIHETLNAQTWASYHDRFSIGLPRKWPKWPNLQGCLADSEILKRIEDFSMSQNLSGLQVVDHLTNFSKIENQPHNTLVWPLTAKTLHIIQTVNYTP